jgi:hypothetical protein
MIKRAIFLIRNLEILSCSLSIEWKTKCKTYLICKKIMLLCSSHDCLLMSYYVSTVKFFFNLFAIKEFLSFGEVYIEGKE